MVEEAISMRNAQCVMIAAGSSGIGVVDVVEQHRVATEELAVVEVFGEGFESGIWGFLKVEVKVEDEAAEFLCFDLNLWIT